MEIEGRQRGEREGRQRMEIARGDREKRQRMEIEGETERGDREWR